MSDQSIDIRPITLDDAAAAAGLCGELGYPIDAASMAARLAQMLALGDHAIFVACSGAQVVGWIHVAIVLHMQSAPRAEIGGLVVTEQVRSQRVGARLVARAERWARERGLDGMLVRSQIKREAAHRFYLREGYAQTKVSAVFSKALTD